MIEHVSQIGRSKIIVLTMQNRETTKGYSRSKSRVKTWQVRGVWSQQLEH